MSSNASSSHPRLPTRRRLRTIELLRAGWGAALLFAPRHVTHNVHHITVDTKSVAIARILGARQLSQAALPGLRPSPEVLAMGVWVDAVHALTALALAGADHSRARAGLTDTAVAGIWAAAGYFDLARGRATPSAHQHLRDHLARIVLDVVPGGGVLMRKITANRRRP